MAASSILLACILISLASFVALALAECASSQPRTPLEHRRCAVSFPRRWRPWVFRPGVEHVLHVLSSGTRAELPPVRGRLASPGGGCGQSNVCATRDTYFIKQIPILQHDVVLRPHCNRALRYGACIYFSFAVAAVPLVPTLRLAILSHVSVLGLRQARQSLFWQISVLVA